MLLRLVLPPSSFAGDGTGGGTFAKPFQSTDSRSGDDMTALKSPSRLTCRTCAVAFFQMALRLPKTVRDCECVRMMSGGLLLVTRSLGDVKTKFDDRSPGRSMAERGRGVCLVFSGGSKTAVVGAGGRVL